MATFGYTLLLFASSYFVACLALAPVGTRKLLSEESTSKKRPVLGILASAIVQIFVLLIAGTLLYPLSTWMGSLTHFMPYREIGAPVLSALFLLLIFTLKSNKHT
ncbi:MAG: hypothetical protein WDZ88_00130 [Candidatus Paceibacterota bacterium]